MTDVVEEVVEGTALAVREPTVHQRMLAILRDLPPIGKTQKNVQQGFMFRGQDDMLNALNPLFARHGVLVIPDVIERIAEHRTTAKGSVMFEINLHVRYRFYGANGDFIEGSGWGEGTDMGDKATSKAMTMAFKYVLNQAFAISTAETVDPDRESPPESVRRKKETVAEPESKTRPGGSGGSSDEEVATPSGSATVSRKPATQPQLKLIEEMKGELEASGVISPADFPLVLKAEFGRDSAEGLTSGQASTLIGRLKAKLESSYGPPQDDSDDLPWK